MRSPSTWNAAWPTPVLSTITREQQLQAEAPGDRPQADGAAVASTRPTAIGGDEHEPDERLKVVPRDLLLQSPRQSCGHVRHMRRARAGHPRRRRGGSMAMASVASARGVLAAARRRCSAARGSARRRGRARPASAGSRMPAARSIVSPTLARPAPSSIDARPTSSASSRVTISRRRRRHHAGAAPPAAGARGRARSRASPPWRTIIASNFASAAPERQRRRATRASASSSLAPSRPAAPSASRAGR